MGLSQYIGASAYTKPGVCTSTTRPAAPYTGQVIFETDTNRMLVWNTSAWVIPNSPAQNPTGMELIETRNASGSPINFYSSLSGRYRSYRILVTTSGNTASQDILMRLTSGTTAIEGTSYSSGGYRIDYANAGGVAAQVDIGVGYFLVGRLDSGGAYGTMDIMLFNPFEASATGMSSQFMDARFVGNRGGRHAVSTSYDGFTIVTTGSFVGHVSLYGMRM